MSREEFDGPSPSQTVKAKRLQELSEIDRQLVTLIEQRAAILRREGSWRRSKQMSKVDPKLEKQLRASWEEAGHGLGLDPRLSRQVFGLINQFALQAGRTAGTANAYNLAPGREPASARINGPRSRRLSRMWAAMAASAGQPLNLEHVPDSGPVKDFVKAMTQAGVRADWDHDTLLVPQAEGFVFENSMIFTGAEPENFYVFLCFALGHMGRTKFTGQSTLQTLDLGPLNKLLPKLGARLAAMNPNNPGLPVRLESGGPMDEEITLLPGIDDEFASSLALAAWSFAGGLTIRGIPVSARPGVADAVSVLKACGIHAELNKDTCTVADGIPEIPASPVLPLDIELASTLLALPAFSRGTVTIDGVWADSDLGTSVLDGLRDLGLEIAVTENQVISSAGSTPKEATINFGQYPALYPLALAFGLKVGTATLEGPIPEVAVELLDRMEVDYEITDKTTLVIKPGELLWEGSWASPDIMWTLACALMAYVRPHIALENHGELTVVWPQFWNFYNTLPTGRMKPRPGKEDPNDKRRRIKVRS